jgi:hypothetical protein
MRTIFTRLGINYWNGRGSKLYNLRAHDQGKIIAMSKITLKFSKDFLLKSSLVKGIQNCPKKGQVLFKGEIIPKMQK